MGNHGNPHGETSKIDLMEHGAPRDGAPQSSDRRLFIQLLALECPHSPEPAAVGGTLCEAMNRLSLPGVVYADVHHPWGLGVVVMSESADDLVIKVRSVFDWPQLPEGLRVRSEYAMLGRTYSSGFETDLLDWLLQRPRRTLLDPRHQFGIWYPLRRKGGFERLEASEKGSILREHGGIGRAYGDQDLAHDIRLACHGLDPNDNDFVIGLIGRELFPLSHVVQSMRRTRQTAEHMDRMGPFFVGRVLYRTEC